MKNHFAFWAKDKKHFTAQELDDVIARKEIQKSIASSSNNQAILAYIEGNMAKKYFSVIHHTTLELRSKIKQEDFINLPLKDFLKLPQVIESTETFQILSNYIRIDIVNHVGFDARQNAFRRMVWVANELFKANNFCAFLSVMTALYLVQGSESFVKGLPKHYRETYDNLFKYAQRDDNAKLLRKHYKNISDENKVFPLGYFAEDWTHLHEAPNFSKEHYRNEINNALVFCNDIKSVNATPHEKTILNEWKQIVASKTSMYPGVSVTETPKLYQKGLIPFFKQFIPGLKDKHLESIYPINYTV